jgi:2-iminobutanoate/2-iminopropanoate deaminase
MERTIIETASAPKAIGPYSQAIRLGDYLFCAGQIPLDPATGELIQGDVKAQTERAIQNLQAVLAAAGLSLDRVVKTTVFLVDMADFAAMNEIYSRAFGSSRPARSTVAVAGLPRGARVEIEAIAG